ncbi:MAG: hypothetical protein KatS3mg005_1274 [Bryobacteraceae bacterium]|nr:MAG: hypothetical protein KatS3mg005_1274 [Bryobacteraceae bacterium]
MLSAIERHYTALQSRWRKIHPFLLPGLFAAMLAASAWWISCERANPDLWLQLLAAEGILDGRGYGFEEQGKWISIADRPPITRWPPGISVIAAAITMLGGNPLIFLTYAYPILLAASYLIVFTALRVHVPLAAAAIGAFYALSFHSVIQSHRVLQSEPLALFLSLVMAKLCAESDFRFWNVIKIVVVGFILTMVRASGAFVVTGAVAGYVFRNQSVWSRRLAYSSALIGVTLLPILLLQSGDSATAKPVVVVKEMAGNSLPVFELIGPHFYPNGRL